MSDIILQRGFTQTLTFRIKQGGAVPLDLTGSQLVLTIESGPSRIEYSSPGRIVIANPASGEATLTLTSQETQSLPRGRLAGWELERRIGTGPEFLGRGMIIGE